MTLRLLARPTRAALTACAIFVTGCYGTPQVSDDEVASREARDSLLHMEIEPTQAEIYVDGEYRGRVSNWRGGMMPLASGNRRVAVRAPGYITPRADVRIGPREKVTYRLIMEPELDTLDPAPLVEDSAARPPRPTMTTP